MGNEGGKERGGGHGPIASEERGRKRGANSERRGKGGGNEGRTGGAERTQKGTMGRLRCVCVCVCVCVCYGRTWRGREVVRVMGSNVVVPGECVCVCVYVCMYVCMHVCLCVCVRMCAWG